MDNLDTLNQSLTTFHKKEEIQKQKDTRSQRIIDSHKIEERAKLREKGKKEFQEDCNTGRLHEGYFSGHTHTEKSKRQTSESLKAFFLTEKGMEARERVSKEKKGVPHKPNDELVKRNSEIVRLYALDREKYSYKTLSEQFGISRDIICDVLCKAGNGFHESAQKRSEEMKKLVLSEPRKWTIKELAIHFNTTDKTVRNSCPGLFRQVQAEIRIEDTKKIVKEVRKGKTFKEVSILFNCSNTKVRNLYYNFFK